MAIGRSTPIASATMQYMHCGRHRGRRVSSKVKCCLLQGCKAAAAGWSSAAAGPGATRCAMRRAVHHHANCGAVGAGARRGSPRRKTSRWTAPSSGSGEKAGVGGGERAAYRPSPRGFTRRYGICHVSRRGRVPSSPSPPPRCTAVPLPPTNTHLALLQQLRDGPDDGAEWAVVPLLVGPVLVAAKAGIVPGGEVGGEGAGGVQRRARTRVRRRVSGCRAARCCARRCTWLPARRRRLRRWCLAGALQAQRQRAGGGAGLATPPAAHLSGQCR